MHVMRVRIILILIVVMSSYSTTGNAAIPVNNLLDQILDGYVAAASGWANYIQARASTLFWILATISMVWTFGMLHMRRADISEFFGELIRFIVFTGFFWWLLINGPIFATDIMDSMKQVGATASGNGNALTPSFIADIGFNIFFRVLEKATIWDPVDSAIGIITSLIILICIALIAINMLLLLISGWILAYAGIFFLGFGGSRWTSDMAIGYFKTVLSIGAQLLTMILLVGIGRDIINAHYLSLDENMNLHDLGIMLVSAIALLVLTNKVPPLMGQLAMGGGAHALGSGYGAGAAVAAASMAGAAAAMGGAMLASTASNVFGAAQAAHAAYKKADESSSDSTAGKPLMENAGASGGGSAGSPPLAQAMGMNKSASSSTKSGSVGSILAKGFGDVMKGKAQERIDQSFMGQVAKAIKGEEKKNDAPVFDGNNLSASIDPKQEVDDFVKRSA